MGHVLPEGNGVITRCRKWAEDFCNPAFMRRVNGFAALFWVAMIPVSLFLHWLSSVTYVAALSIWALVSGHWSAWQSARVEDRQDKDADVQEVLDTVKNGK